MTKAEIILWSRIRLKKIDGYKFRRQHPLLGYIVDFYCNDLKLIIEVDGEIHSFPERINYDSKRDNILKNNGYYILRFSNVEVETDINGTLKKIESFIAKHVPLSKGSTACLEYENQY